MIKKLTLLANSLDQKGLFQYANRIDEILKEAINNFARSSLILALKNDDAAAAKQVLTGRSGDDFGLTHQEFGWLTNGIHFANEHADSALYADSVKKRMDKARELLGVGKNVKIDPRTSGPVNPVEHKSDALQRDELKFIWKYGKQYADVSQHSDVMTIIGNAILKHKSLGTDDLGPGDIPHILDILVDIDRNAPKDNYTERILIHIVSILSKWRWK